MRKFIVSFVFIVLIVAVALIEHYLSPWKMYFSMSLAAVYFLYIGVEFTLDYVNFVKGYKERYTLYKAELVNKMNLPLEVIESQNKKYYKRFKRSILSERIYAVIKFALCYSFTIALVIAMAIG